VSLVLQLPQLGCMTLMPLDQLLPSQVAELLSDAGLPDTEATFQALRARLREDKSTEALQVC
jgi:hypothetical protein